MTPTFEDLVAFAKKIEGQPIYTLKRAKPFFVNVESGRLRFTPAKSSSVRRSNTEEIKSVLKRFADTGSFEPGKYSEISFNASYVLALVDAFRSKEK